MITILTLADYYLPGYKAGGALRSLANLVQHLSDDFSFKIITRDREWLENEPYPDMRSGDWNRVGSADVFYLRPRASMPWQIYRILRSIRYDILYLNSLFSLVFTLAVLLLRRIGLLPPVPVVLAPRGQLSPGAFAINQRKKDLFIKLANRVGLYRDVIWQASSAYEEEDIRRHFDVNSSHPVRVLIAPDLPVLPAGHLRARGKAAGELRVVFFSRIARKKNLAGALRILAGVPGPIVFDIYGPVEDPEYWEECKSLIRELPAHITVNFRGALEHAKVGETLCEYNLFLFPTLGENYGHVIVEALAAGCPVLISDQTAFRGLDEKKVGWDIPLADLDSFRARVAECVAMDEEQHARVSRAARTFALGLLTDETAAKQNRALFRSAVGVESVLDAKTSRR